MIEFPEVLSRGLKSAMATVMALAQCYHSNTLKIIRQFQCLALIPLVTKVLGCIPHG